MIESEVRRDGVFRGVLVYIEEHALVAQAIRREKRIKHWPRRWKLDLIEGVNPEWHDLLGDLL
jgi:putative endonuclease